MVDYDEVAAEIEREEQVDSVTEYLEKTKQIKKEISRLNRLFKGIDENKKNLVKTTIEDVAFMTVTMRDLREVIVRKGTTCTYKNGENQYGTKQSPDAQLYLQLSQKQTQAMKILTDCLPKAQKEIMKEDGFNDFVSGREDL